MALEESDLPIIVDAVRAVVDRVVAERMEQVYAVLEETREQMQLTVQTLEGNDNALLGEIRRVQGATPAEVLAWAGESWSRFIVGEAKQLGLRIIVPKEMPDAQ